MSDDTPTTGDQHPTALHAMMMHAGIVEIAPRVINHHGDVSVGWSQNWQTHDDLKGKSIMHTNFNNAHKPSCERFPRSMFPREGGLQQAAIFWVKPSILKMRTIDQLDELVHAAAAELADDLNIHPIETRLFVPNDNLREKLGSNGAIGIVMATDEAHAKYLPQLIERLQAEYRTVEVRREAAKEKSAAPAEPTIPASSQAFLNGATNWAQRFQANGNSSQRDGQALRDVMLYQHDVLPIQKVRIQKDGFVSFHLPAPESAILRQKPESFDFDASSSRLAKQTQLHDTDGLAIWMTPDFFDPAKIESRAKENPLPLNDGMSPRKRVTLNKIVPKLDVMAKALSRQFDIPITATLCRMDPEILPNCAANAPSVVVLGTTDGINKDGISYQHVLHTQVAKELERRHESALREASQPNPLDVRRSGYAGR